MPVDASIVFAPRFTTLVGAVTVTSLPLDVSEFTGAQFQIGRGAIRVKPGTGAGSLTIAFEESLDTETWVLGPNTPEPFVIATGTPAFFSYNFRLRWFRLKMTLAGTDPIVSLWAEGLLRGGGGGAWAPAGASAARAGAMAQTGMGPTLGVVMPPAPIPGQVMKGNKGSGPPSPIKGGLGA